MRFRDPSDRPGPLERHGRRSRPRRRFAAPDLEPLEHRAVPAIFRGVSQFGFPVEVVTGRRESDGLHVVSNVIFDSRLEAPATDFGGFFASPVSGLSFFASSGPAQGGFGSLEFGTEGALGFRAAEDVFCGDLDGGVVNNFADNFSGTISEDGKTLTLTMRLQRFAPFTFENPEATYVETITCPLFIPEDLVLQNGSFEILAGGGIQEVVPSQASTHEIPGEIPGGETRSINMASRFFSGSSASSNPTYKLVEGSGDGWTIRMIRGGQDVTEAFRQGTDLPFAEVRLTPGPNAAPVKELVFEMRSGFGPLNEDFVYGGLPEEFQLAQRAIVRDSVKLVARTIDDTPGDLQVKPGTSPLEPFVGQGIRGAEPAAGQQVRLIAPPGQATRALVRVENTGSEPRTFFLRRTEDAAGGFDVRYRFAGIDVTGFFAAGGFTTPLIQPGGAEVIEIAVTPEASLPGGFTRTVTLRQFTESQSTDVIDAVGVIAVTGLVVNTSVDTVDQIPGDGLIDSDPNTPGQQISLREAITLANRTGGPQVITFAIPGDPAIKATSLLPAITEAVRIDGSTQPGGSVEIVGGQAGPDERGLELSNAFDVNLKGLMIHSFGGDGILIQGGAGHVLDDLIVGLDRSIISSNLQRAPNGSNGIRIVNSHGNTIQNSVISGNTRHGVSIEGQTSRGNVLQGNFIGTTRESNPDAELGNGQFGVVIDNAPGNVIGLVSSGNVITGNGTPITAERGEQFDRDTVVGGGVLITGDDARDNRLSGNDIGYVVKPDGKLARVHAGRVGIRIENAPGNRIGGAGEGNRISGGKGQFPVLFNDPDGLSINEVILFGIGLHITGQGSTGNVVEGNRIAEMELPGTTFLLLPGGGEGGVVIDAGASGNRIGGPASGAGNEIVGNGIAGIHLRGPGTSGNIVQGNLIGLMRDGTTASNLGSGVLIENAPGNIIGGLTDKPGTGPGNVISANLDFDVLRAGDDDRGRFRAAGIDIRGAGSTGNTVLGNLIGTDAAGLKRVANGGYGVRILAASGNTIGSADPRGGNVISGNALYGIAIVEAGNFSVPLSDSGLGLPGIGFLEGPATGNQVLGNLIGPALGGGSLQVVEGPGVDRFNHGFVVEVPDEFQGDFLLTVGAGVLISGDGNTIGGLTPTPGTGPGNVISKGSGHGIEIRGRNNRMMGNAIGEAIRDAQDPAANDRFGIVIAGGSGNLIGGTEPGAANLIAHSGLEGIRFLDLQADTAILGNRIFANGGIGISRTELSFRVFRDGIAFESAPGESDLAPPVSSVAATGAIRTPDLFGMLAFGPFRAARGSLTAPAGTYLIEIYLNAEADPSGFGEGQTFLARQEIFIPAGQPSESFLVSLPADAATPGRFITATATRIDGDGNPVVTSEFSRAVSTDVTDTDQDGVDDAIEDLAGGDIDGDGTPDRDQDFVTRVPVIKPDGTLSLEETIGLFEINRRPFRNVRPVPVSVDGTAGTIPGTLPLPPTVKKARAIKFRVEKVDPILLGIPSSSAVAFRLLFPGNRLIKVLPDFTFKDITNDPNVTFRDDLVEFVILDGGEYDGDLLANGIVEDPIIFADVNETDLAIAAIAPAILVPNQTARFEIRISNIGLQLAMLPTVVSDPLPAALQFVGASDGGTFDPATRRITWKLDGTLAAGSTKNFEFTANTVAAEPLNFTVTMRQNPFLVDTLIGNDTAPVSAAIAPPGQISLTRRGNSLVIRGDANANAIRVDLGAAGPGTVSISSTDSSIDGKFSSLALTGISDLTIDTGEGADIVDVAGFLGRRTSVSIRGGGGFDTIRSFDATSMTLSTTQLVARQRIRLNGFEAAHLAGGPGNDRLDASGFSGAVILEGLPGNDSLIAANGPSQLFGGPGNDTLTGDPARDVLDGGPGRNRLVFRRRRGR